jgi:hypothetical protein
MSKPKARRMVIAGAATLGCCLASSVAKAMEDKCEAEGSPPVERCLACEADGGRHPWSASRASPTIGQGRYREKLRL